MIVFERMAETLLQVLLVYEKKVQSISPFFKKKMQGEQLHLVYTSIKKQKKTTQ